MSRRGVRRPYLTHGTYENQYLSPVVRRPASPSSNLAHRTVRRIWTGSEQEQTETVPV